MDGRINGCENTINNDVVEMIHLKLQKMGPLQRQKLIRDILVPSDESLLKTMNFDLGQTKFPRETRNALTVNLASQGLNITQKAVTEYYELKAALQPWINLDHPYVAAKWNLPLKFSNIDGYQLQLQLLERICEDNICHLKGADIEFIDVKQLVLMFKEILVHIDYYFEARSDEPFVIDGGVNIGLALYYIVTLYPNAHIIGFEPFLPAYECALRNIERNHWDNVIMHNCALSDTESDQVFYILSSNSTAGSLTNRMETVSIKNQEHLYAMNVHACKLSKFLDKPVDFLKLDIEGVELKVLRESKTYLSNVNQLFIEYHYSDSIPENSLAEILTLLENVGFSYEVTKSHSFTKGNQTKPMTHIGKNISCLIWARRIEDKH